MYFELSFSRCFNELGLSRLVFEHPTSAFGATVLIYCVSNAANYHLILQKDNLGKREH